MAYRMERHYGATVPFGNPLPYDNSGFGLGGVVGWQMPRGGYSTQNRGEHGWDAQMGGENDLAMRALEQHAKEFEASQGNLKEQRAWDRDQAQAARDEARSMRTEQGANALAIAQLYAGLQGQGLGLQRSAQKAAETESGRRRTWEENQAAETLKDKQRMIQIAMMQDEINDPNTPPAQKRMLRAQMRNLWGTQQLPQGQQIPGIGGQPATPAEGFIRNEPMTQQLQGGGGGGAPVGVEGRPTFEASREALAAKIAAAKQQAENWTTTGERDTIQENLNRLYRQMERLKTFEEGGEGGTPIDVNDTIWQLAGGSPQRYAEVMQRIEMDKADAAKKLQLIAPEFARSIAAMNPEQWAKYGYAQAEKALEPTRAGEGRTQAAEVAKMYGLNIGKPTSVNAALVMAKALNDKIQKGIIPPEHLSIIEPEVRRLLDEFQEQSGPTGMGFGMAGEVLLEPFATPQRYNALKNLRERAYQARKNQWLNAVQALRANQAPGSMSYPENPTPSIFARE